MRANDTGHPVVWSHSMVVDSSFVRGPIGVYGFSGEIVDGCVVDDGPTVRIRVLASESTAPLSDNLSSLIRGVVHGNHPKCAVNLSAPVAGSNERLRRECASSSGTVYDPLKCPTRQVCDSNLGRRKRKQFRK